MTTADIDPWVTDRARRFLDTTGYQRVRVVLGDATADGLPEHAPYDRIIVAVGMHTPATVWIGQLAPGGRILIPLRLRGLHRVGCFVRHGDTLVSSGHFMAGFVAVQGALESPETRIPLAEPGIMLCADRGAPPVEVTALSRALAGERVCAWSGVLVASMEPFDDLLLWLATVTEPPYRITRPNSTEARAVLDSASPTVAVLIDGESFAYPAHRKAGEDTWELGAHGHGPRGNGLAQALADQIRTWHQHHRGQRQAVITVLPAQTPTDATPPGVVFAHGDTTVLLTWPDPTDPAALRTAMVDKLRRWGSLTEPRVEQAMLSVPRHLFLPGVDLERAYDPGDAVVTHRDGEGVATSSASAPSVVARMLQQLDPQPGDRVLEVGAGTGYNAALLARLVGPTGMVTTIEYDEIVAGEARTILATIAPNVVVATGDGMLGHPANSPYDKIIITAGAWDLPPSWWEQLAPAGRLVLPLRMRGLTQSVAFERTGEDVLSSVSVHELGFIPMKGIDAVLERNIPVRLADDDADPAIVVRVDDNQSVDAQALMGALAHPAVTVWSGVSFAWLSVDLAGLPFWLATLPGFCRLLVWSGPVAAGRVVAPIFRWGSFGAYDGATLAYVTYRTTTHPDHGQVNEVGACAYGPDAAGLAERVAARLRDWFADGGQNIALSVQAHRLPAPDPIGALLVADKKHTRIVVRASSQAVVAVG